MTIHDRNGNMYPIDGRLYLYHFPIFQHAQQDTPLYNNMPINSYYATGSKFHIFRKLIFGGSHTRTNPQYEINEVVDAGGVGGEA